MALILLLLHFLKFAAKSASSELVFEQGYTVETVIDGNKLQNQIHPFSIIPRARDIVLLDYVNNTFYTISIPISQESKINRLSGSGEGFSDGDLTAAMFNHPRSFAVDLRGNVYVAERNNHAIRKINSSGVTTIAGGFSEKTGHKDGPALNASFSNDFELVFIPNICALLVSDRGNRMVRQINLKPEDCASKSRLVAFSQSNYTPSAAGYEVVLKPNSLVEAYIGDTNDFLPIKYSADILAVVLKAGKKIRCTDYKTCRATFCRALTIVDTGCCSIKLTLLDHLADDSWMDEYDPSNSITTILLTAVKTLICGGGSLSSTKLSCMLTNPCIQESSALHSWARECAIPMTLLQDDEGASALRICTSTMQPALHVTISSAIELQDSVVPVVRFLVQLDWPAKSNSPHLGCRVVAWLRTAGDMFAAAANVIYLK